MAEQEVQLMRVAAAARGRFGVHPPNESATVM
jgi:hypothetical protein